MLVVDSSTPSPGPVRPPLGKGFQADLGHGLGVPRHLMLELAAPGRVRKGAFAVEDPVSAVLLVLFRYTGLADFVDGRVVSVALGPTIERIRALYA